MQAYLTEDDLLLILLQALIKARKLRANNLHIAIAGRNKNKAALIHVDNPNNNCFSKVNLAKEKAMLTLRNSHDKLAKSSSSINKNLAGGIPLYKSVTSITDHVGTRPQDKLKYTKSQPYLVGTIGISGHTPEIDEAIALAASEGFMAPVSIRSESFTLQPGSSLSDNLGSSVPPFNQQSQEQEETGTQEQTQERTEQEEKEETEQEEKEETEQEEKEETEQEETEQEERTEAKEEPAKEEPAKEEPAKEEPAKEEQAQEETEQEEDQKVISNLQSPLIVSNLPPLVISSASQTELPPLPGKKDFLLDLSSRKSNKKSSKMNSKISSKMNSKISSKMNSKISSKMNSLPPIPTSK
jgi:uncharacterized protein GlcG (DUF336 family)